jgi:hypothetical protein
MSTAICTPNKKMQPLPIQTMLTPAVAGILVDGIEEFEVESILNSRIRWGKLEYLVHRKGYADEEDTWEPEDNVENSTDLIHQFHRDHRSALHIKDSKIVVGADSDEAQAVMKMTPMKHPLTNPMSQMKQRTMRVVTIWML